MKTVEPKSKLDINRDVLSQKHPHEGGFGERPAILIWNRSGHIALKERKEREPDTRSAAVLIGLRVCQRVVVQEQSGGDIERDEDVDGVMFMSRQDEEDSKQVQHPGHGVDEVPVTWCVFSDKKVEHGENNSVSTEHIITTCMNTS